MIAVDTNVLVYAHRRDSAWHGSASTAVRKLAEQRNPWAIPWPCVHEFFSVVTHPRIYSPPSAPDQAVDQLEAWLASPSVTLLAETTDYWTTLKKLLKSSQTTGPQAHDARIAALCQLHGVRELWTADRDFSRFVDLVTRNPLIG